MTKYKKITESFEDSMERIASPEVGDVEDFFGSLEKKLKAEIEELQRKHGVWSFSQLLGRGVQPGKGDAQGVGPSIRPGV